MDINDLQFIVVAKNFHDKQKINDLMREAYDERERMGFCLLNLLAKRKNTTMYAIYYKERFIAMTIITAHKDMAYVLYLATVASERDKGYGAMILQQIKQIYSGYRITLTANALKEGEGEDSFTARRLAFYKRNGFLELGFKVRLAGVVDETLYVQSNIADNKISQQEYMGLLNVVFPFWMRLKVSPKLVQ